MSSPKIQSLISVVFAILPIVVRGGESRSPSPEEVCKTLKPAPVNERWLSSVGTWYVMYIGKIEDTVFSSEEGSSKSSKSKPPKKSTPVRAGGGTKKGAKKFCYSLEFDPGVFGHGRNVSINYTCNYYDGNVAAQSCTLKEVDGVSLGRSAPERIKYYAGLVAQEQSKVYVMTDNKTYFAEVTCLPPRGVRTFALYSVKPADPGKAVRKGVQKRLGGMGLDLENVSDSVNKKPVRITNCNGPPTLSAPAKKGGSKTSKASKKG